MKLIITLMLMAIGHLAFAQASLELKSKTITVEKSAEQLVIPLVVNVKNRSPKNQWMSIKLLNETAKLKFRELKKKINKEDEVTFYGVIEKDTIIKDTTQFNVEITLDGDTVRAGTTIAVKSAPDLTYMLGDYYHDPKLKLNYVTKVESTDNILTLYGYHGDNDDVVVKRKIMLKRRQVFKIFNSDFRLLRPDLSLLTVPFKIRPRKGDLRANAQSGLTNLGLNLDFLRGKWDTYFPDATKKSQKVSMGIWLAPSVEELNAENATDANLGDKKSKQIFLSTGLTFSYSFNAISFVIVPVGFDLPMSELGKKWVYKHQYWWGFGIAIEPKALAAILNK